MVRGFVLWVPMTRPIVMRREQGFGANVKAEMRKMPQLRTRASPTRKRLVGS